jgi:hypothetical protein
MCSDKAGHVSSTDLLIHQINYIVEGSTLPSNTSHAYSGQQDKCFFQMSVLVVEMVQNGCVRTVHLSAHLR